MEMDFQRWLTSLFNTTESCCNQVQQFTVQVSDPFQLNNYSVGIFNVLGEIIYSCQLIPDGKGSRARIDLSLESGGIYLIQVRNGRNRMSKKITVE